MNPGKVELMLEELRECRYDDEKAHALEDTLFMQVLRAIAEGTCEAPAECARLALTSADIEFHRWCA